MPKMIVVDGPEKSGKSHLLDEIERQALDQGYFILKQHWNKPQLNHWSHKRRLMEQFDSARMEERMNPGRKGLILWNRSQASEAIYSKLLNRGGVLAEDPLIGEFQYGRAELTLGPRLILLGPSLETLIAHRDSTDLPVDPAIEREMYRAYGLEYGFRVYENTHDPVWVRNLASSLLQELTKWPNYDTLSTYTGPVKPKYIVLASTTVNAWIPYSNPVQTRPWQKWGGKILEYGFATMDAPKDVLRKADTLVIPAKMGAHVRTFARYYLGYPESKVITTVEFQKTILGKQTIGAKS